VTYNPLVDPAPDHWLDLSEQERIDAVLDHHRFDGLPASQAELHAVTHVVIETILAEGTVEGASAKLRELVADGLDRHEAIHAMGTAVAGVIFETLQSADDGAPPEKSQRLVARRLAEVTAESWRELAAPESPPAVAYEDPEAPWVAELECEDDLDDEVADRIVELGEHAVEPLLRRIEASLVPDDESWACVHAVRLLGRIGDPRAIAPLFSTIDATESGDPLHEASILTLPQFGTALVEPALARARVLEPDDIEIMTCADVLSRCGVADPRIFALLEDILPFFPDFTAGCFADYGDPKALPILHDVLERHVLVGEIDVDRIVVDLADAIESLDGTLSGAESRKLEAYHARRRETHGQPAIKSERPGRNDPCWCGSGKKYKKCHLRADDGLA